MVYAPVAASKVALPGTRALPMSDCPSKMPMGVLNVVLGRWKSGGGATCGCVADPGCAQSGACGTAEAGALVVVWGASRNGAAQTVRTASIGRTAVFFIQLLSSFSPRSGL